MSMWCLTVRLAELATGTRFRLAEGGVVYVARGGGWYSSPEGYDGGPWVASGETAVIVLD